MEGSKIVIHLPDSASFVSYAYALVGKEQKLGRIVKPGIAKLFIGWGAHDTNTSAYTLIQNTLKAGARVTLQKDYSGTWKLLYQGNVIGQLRKDAFQKEPNLT